MRILLVNIDYTHHSSSPIYGLGYLAAVSRDAGHTVSIFDGNHERASLEHYYEAVRLFRPDLLGFTVMCTGFGRLIQILKYIRARGINVPMIVGGPQIAANPLEFTKYLEVDFGCYGEGEKTLLELIDHLEEAEAWKDIKGLVFRDRKGQYHQTPPRPLLKDLDTLPFPAYDLMKLLDFNHTPVTWPVKKLPYANIYTTRGCPFSCTFCSSHTIWGKRMRARKPEKCVDEIQYLMREFGVREIFIGDDNFTFNKKHPMAFCEELLRRNIDIPWQCPNGLRIDTLDEELLVTMKRAGCHAIGLGIESGNDDILKTIKKNLSTALIREKLHLINKVGIRTQGFFILGFPHESRNQILDTIRFAIELPLQSSVFSIMTPYPGSEVYEDYYHAVSVEHVPWDNFDLHHGQSDIDTLPSEELIRLMQKAYLKFYLRPRVIADTFSYMIKPRVVKSLFQTRLIRQIFRYKIF
jgi:radical SAM superfamily enzyme YgiQ (UPF0313 family)